MEYKKALETLATLTPALGAGLAGWGVEAYEEKAAGPVSDYERRVVRRAWPGALRHGP
jgi:hypothetical protein